MSSPAEDPVASVDPVPDSHPPSEPEAPAGQEKKEAVPKAKKAAASPKKRKPRSGPKHPPYVEMAIEAIASLKERTGSSQYAIAKYIEEKHKASLAPNFKKFLGSQLKKLAADGKIVKVKNSFKLPPIRPRSTATVGTAKTSTKKKPITTAGKNAKKTATAAVKKVKKVITTIVPAKSKSNAKAAIKAKVKSSTAVVKTARGSVKRKATELISAAKVVAKARKKSSKDSPAGKKKSAPLKKLNKMPILVLKVAKPSKKKRGPANKKAKASPRKKKVIPPKKAPVLKKAAPAKKTAAAAPVKKASSAPKKSKKVAPEKAPAKRSGPARKVKK